MSLTTARCLHRDCCRCAVHAAAAETVPTTIAACVDSAALADGLSDLATRLAIRLQAQARRVLAVRMVAARRRGVAAVVALQAAARGTSARAAFARSKRCVVIAQAACRRVLVRRRMGAVEATAEARVAQHVSRVSLDVRETAGLMLAHLNGAVVSKDARGRVHVR
jgi:hypothetical protein